MEHQTRALILDGVRSLHGAKHINGVKATSGERLQRVFGEAVSHERVLGTGVRTGRDASTWPTGNRLVAYFGRLQRRRSVGLRPPGGTVDPRERLEHLTEVNRHTHDKLDAPAVPEGEDH